MEHEQRDTYLIPPNFIEGGTLLGRMFKTRNVTEAGILGSAIALPVMGLGFSLTVRIIILCLTALPLVLVALIGIGGSSLSAFILLFKLSAEPPCSLAGRSGKRKNGKERSMLPTWLRGKRAAVEPTGGVHPH